MRSPRILRFGPFELNTSDGELRQNGVRIRLQEQPYKVLVSLIEAPGEVVAREDLIRVLWPEGTFVDYDRSLNAAVTRVRQVLGDSAERPRYIETVARKGYRFIAPVEEVGVTPTAGAPTASVPGKNRRQWFAAAAGLMIVLIGAGVTLWTRSDRKSGQTALAQLTHDSGLTMDPAVSRDGKLLAYVSDRTGGRLNLYVQQLVPGGTSVQLTHENVDVREPAFSPDGSKIVFESEDASGGIFVIPTIGGEAVRIVPNGGSPRFSPDGKWISYWVGSRLTSFPDGGNWGTTYIIPASGGEPRRLGADLKAAAYPVWSPDSKHLLVYVNPSLSMPARDQDWWVIAVDGAASRRTGAFAVLERQGIRIGDEYVPRAYDWTPEAITFTGTFEDTVNCWQIAGPDREGRIKDPAQRLTSGTTLEVSPVINNHRVFFASLNQTRSIWAMNADTDRGVVTGLPNRLTHGGGELTPSISENGRELTFTASHTKSTHVRITDLVTGQERTIGGSAGAEWRPTISRDGSVVAYTVWQSGNDEIRLVPASGGTSKRITAGSGFVWWSTKDRLLFSRRFSDRTIILADIPSGKEQVFLTKAQETLYQASFSSDEKWLVVEATTMATPTQLSRIFVIPAPAGVPAPEREWIQVGNDTAWNDKPRWSPDGNTIYFISHEDGFRCLWGQRLHPTTKRPTGPRFALHHFHETRLSMMNIGLGMLEIDVAKDKIVFGLGELTGNVWSMNPR
jgi:Tol biopolymer transport system component/DNA-binding winged helix-turn-helix (wHTH) protein